MDLSRFESAVDRDGERALSEIESGRKRSHWMWYVFPQYAGLGRSAMAERYAITSLDEAAAFLRHPTLGPTYRRLVDAVWEQVVSRGVPIHDLFDSPDDAKLVSSLTLFGGVARELGSDWNPFVERCDAILRLAAAQGLPRCSVTQQVLGGGGHQPPQPGSTR